MQSVERSDTKSDPADDLTEILSDLTETKIHQPSSVQPRANAKLNSDGTTNLMVETHGRRLIPGTPENLENEGLQDDTVDEMKIQTMYKMVDEVWVGASGGEKVMKKVMYLTNNQAHLLNNDSQAVAKCLKIFDINKFKFVIKLMRSTCVESQMRIAHSEMDKTPASEFMAGDYDLLNSELDQSDADTVMRQTILFMNNCILPLARQTNAVIIVNGNNNCALSAALSKVAIAEQARHGKDCPFKVIAIGHSWNVHSKAHREPTSLAAQLMRGSRAWNKRMDYVNRARDRMKKEFVEEDKDDLEYNRQRWYQDLQYEQQVDLTEAASHYMMFECINEADGHYKFVVDNMLRFETLFVQHLRQKCPSVVIASANIRWGLKTLSDFAARNIPVLLLDTCERAVTMRKRLSVSGPSTRQARTNNTEFRDDEPFSSSDQFPIIFDDHLDKLETCDGELTLSSRFEMLTIALKCLEMKYKCHIKNGVPDKFDAPFISFLHSAIRLGSKSDKFSAVGAEVPLWKRINELEESTSKEFAHIPHKLASTAITLGSKLRTEHWNYARLERVKMWLDHHDPAAETFEKAGHKYNSLSIAERYRDKLEKECSRTALKSDSMDGHIFIQMYDILTSPNTYAGSLHDLQDLRRRLDSIAKIDRLPNTNSLEALRTLQEGWDCVDIYHQVADSYKRFTKISFIILLVIGILITAFSLVESRTGYSSRNSILILSFVGTCVAAYVTFTNPATKWQQLRMAAVSIESHIWTFRSRAGVYRTDGDVLLEGGADRLLLTSIREIKAQVLEAADIKRTAFFSRVYSRNRHGQHPPGGRIGTLPYYDEPKFSKGLFSCFLWLFRSRVAPDKMPPRRMQASASPQIGARKLKTSMLAEQLPTMKSEGKEFRLDDIIYCLHPQITQQERLRQNETAQDGHHAPLHPDQYIRFRVVPTLEFYRHRIPNCNRLRNFGQVLIILGSVSGCVLAYLDLSVWAAGISIITAAVTSYLEFQGTSGKLGRYSAIVHKLQDLIFWWQTLPTIERSGPATIDRLVLTCEDFLQREQQAWRSTSQAERMLLKQSEQAQQKQVADEGTE